MIIYLLKSAACLSLLLFFYHLVLEKEKMHQFNRFYLLGSVLFSFLAPLYIIYTEVTPIFIEATNNSTEFVPISETTPMAIVEKTSLDYSSIGIAIYVLISLLFLFRFGKNLFHILQKTRKNKTIKYNNAVLVLVEDKILPHTFWNYIFINKEDYETKSVEKELFTHELTHVNQKHTIDVIILELLQIVFWINPLFIFLKKAIQLNHEFLADDTVINKHKNTFHYQHLLLNKAAWKNEYYLASNLNYSLTKKRLKMMTTQSSQSKILLKKLAVIPLLAGFLFLFAERVEAQKIIEIVEEPKETIVEEKQNISKKDYEKYKILVEKAKNSEIIKQKDVVWMTTIYRKMPNVQKKSVENIFHYLVADVSLSKRKISKNQLKKWQNKYEYAIWIDGKSEENSILKSFKESDFSYFSESFVHKNARSKKFPQNYQVSIYTNKYFKELVDKSSKTEEVVEVREEKSNSKIIEVIEENQIETIEEQVYTKKGKAIKTGFRKLNGKNHYYVKVNNNTKYYNKDGKLADKNGKVLTNKRVNASSVLPDNYITKTFYRGKVFCEFIDDKPELREQFKKELIELLNGTKKTKEPSKSNNEIIEQNKKAKKYIDSPIPNQKSSKQSVVKEIPFLTTTIKAEKETNVGTITDIRLKLKDVNKLKLVYNNTDPRFNKNWYITIDGQKYYYTFDKHERIARYYKNGKLVNLDIVKEYKKKNKIFENLKASGKHYVFKTKEEQKIIDREFSDLGGMYFRMPRIDKNKVPRPKNPVKPYVRLRKGNKIWYKKISELTEEDKLLLPPPPPFPNASKEEIKKARKAYDAWKKRTGNDLPPPPPPKKSKKGKTVAKLVSKLQKDIVALKVEELKNEKNGVYFNYYIKNNGNVTIKAKSYKVYFKVNGIKISFDTSTSLLKPGQIVKYETQKVFYPKNHKSLDYILEIKKKDQNLKNNVLKGKYVFNKHNREANSITNSSNKVSVRTEMYLANNSFIEHKLKKLTEEEILKYEENIQNGTTKKGYYFLDGKEITLRDVNLIESYKIKSVNVTKNKEGFKTMYIKSK